MDKSEAYRQGRAPDGGLFFIRSREQHNLRRKVWGTAFITSSLEHLMKVVEKRTRQMLDTMEKRKSDAGVIDMTEVIRHWSFDLMVCSKFFVVFLAQYLERQGEMTFGSSSRIVSHTLPYMNRLNLKFLRK